MNSILRCCLATFVFSVALPCVVRAEDKGQADLDLAIEKKVSARKMADLEEVIRLCEEARRKGLNQENDLFARQMLAATFMERANSYCRPIFTQKPPSPFWKRLKDMALADIGRAVDLDAELGTAYVLRARLQLLPGGSKEEAVKSLDQGIQRLDNSKHEQSEALVLRATLANDPKKRLTDLDAALVANPENAEALRIRGVHYLTEQQFEKAITDLQVSVEKSPDDVIALQAFAEALVAAEKLEEAVKQLDRVVGLRPDNASGYVLRARLNFMLEKEAAALKDLDRAIKADVRNVPALLMRAQFRLSKGEADDLAQAKRDVERALELQPGMSRAVVLLSLILASQENFEDAITELKRLLRASPEDQNIKLQIAGYYHADGEPSEALEWYQRVLTENADSMPALQGRANAYLEMGKHAEAITDFDAVLKLREDEELDESDVNVLNNFAWVLATSPVDNLRDGSRAVELATKACEITEYKKAYILSTLAACYAELGEFDTAIEWAEKAVQASDDDVKDQLAQELKSYQSKKPWRELKQTEEEPDPDPDQDDLDLEGDLQID